MANHLWRARGMGNQHRYSARAFRPRPQLWEDAKNHARQRELDMNTYLVACVRWLVEQPDIALKYVQPFFNGPTPLGRPRRNI